VRKKFVKKFALVEREKERGEKGGRGLGTDTSPV
jgi:hypothetical protein